MPASPASIPSTSDSDPMAASPPRAANSQAACTFGRIDPAGNRSTISSSTFGGTRRIIRWSGVPQSR